MEDIKKIQKDLESKEKINTFLSNEKRRLETELEIKKKICQYQENLINKLLNTIQNKTLEVNNDLERGYK